MNILKFEELDSTNEYLKKVKDKKNWDLVYAIRQSKGKGRRGKKWFSDEGGAWFSINLNKDKFLDDEIYSKLPLLSGLAVLQSLKETYNEEYKIKWPNDIYVKDKKISGILLEKSDESYIIGIGVNLNLENFGEFNEIASSLKILSGKNYDIEEYIKNALSNLKKLFYRYIQGEWEIILNEINELNYLKGKKIILSDGEEDIEGLCGDIDNNGYLTVVTGKKEYKVGVGDIKIIK